MRRSNRKDPPVFAKGKLFHFEIDGYKVYGHRWNERGEKKILILHGFESSSKNFDRYVSLLIKKGYEVVTLDAPAHGRSSGRQITLPLYVNTVRQVNELFGPFDGFVSHSFGGLVLSHFLEHNKHPDATKAVLIAPATETTSAIDSFFEFLHIKDKVRAEFDKLIFTIGGYWPSHYSVRRALRQVNAQVLWLHDEDDELTPFADAVKVLDDKYSNVIFRATRGLGHRKIYRDNGVVKEVVEFLG